MRQHLRAVVLPSARELFDLASAGSRRRNEADERQRDIAKRQARRSAGG
jgi:hypothetical protein